MINELLKQTEQIKVKEYIETIMRKALDGDDIDVGILEHVIDYFNSRVNNDNIHKIPLKTAIEKSRKWVEKMNQEATKIVETEEDTEVIYDFEDGFKFVKLISKEAFQREGKLMSHCVASYFGKNGLDVLSLRDAKGYPHCTLEVQKSSTYINQIKGKGNGLIHPKYIKYVLKMLELLGQNIRSSELRHLGYDEIDTSLLTYIEANFTGVKKLIYDGKVFIYRYITLKSKCHVK